MPTPKNPKLAVKSELSLRLAASLEQAVGADWRQRRYGIAVSGGPDSMALVWLMAQLLPDQVSAATVDHGLRTNSADEAAMVAAYCAQLGLSHHILCPAQPITGSLQASARTERYRLLEKWRSDTEVDDIVTAHHADDQLETLLMRLNRSSGISGLSGIRRRNGHILRPLLDWRRSELLQIALDANISFVEDPSNQDHRFDRARLRAALKGQQIIDPLSAAQSASWLAEADEALDWAVDTAIAAWPDPTNRDLLYDCAYPAEIFRRILTRRLRLHDPDLTIRGSAMLSIIAAMQSEQRAMVGSLIIDPIPNQAHSWRISAAPCRKSAKTR